MVDSPLSTPKIFKSPHQETPTALFFWSNVRSWAQQQVDGWTPLVDQISKMADVGESDSDLGIGGAELLLNWEGIVDIAEKVLSQELDSAQLEAAETKLNAAIKNVVEGYWIASESNLGRFIYKLAKSDIRKAFEYIDGEQDVKNLDPHLVRWGPYVEMPIEINIPGYGRTLTFNSWDDFSNWAIEERSAWQGLLPLENLEPAFGRAVLDAHIKHFGDIASSAKRLIDEAGHANALKNLSQKTTMLLEGQIFPLSGAIGHELKHLFANHPVAAFARIATRNGANVSIQTPEKTSNFAPLLAEMLNEQSKYSDPHVFLQGANTALAELTNDWKDQKEEALANAAKIGQDVDSKRTQFTQLSAELLKTHRQEINDAKDDMARLQQTYEQLMKLKAPAKYWHDKRRNHFFVASLSFMAFCTVGYFAGDFVWQHKAEVLNAISPPHEVAAAVGAEKEKIPKVASPSSGWQIGTLVLVTIPTLMLFWLLRLISRIFVTNLAGISDASHRATLISTFLALVNSDDSDIGPEERLLLIQGIMSAPGASGDDAAPSAMLENLAKNIATK